MEISQPSLETLQFEMGDRGRIARMVVQAAMVVMMMQATVVTAGDY